MPTKNTIQVSEFEKLYYDDKKPFKKKHWEALCHYLEQQNKKEEKRVEYFGVLHKGIQFNNFTGVIQAGNLTIEILPKTDRSSTIAANETLAQLHLTNEPEAKEKAKWHKVLLDMLKECKLLRVNHVDYARLNLRNNSILDIYIEIFLTETEQLLHEGLLKKYRKQEGNQAALKGQLQFAQQIAYNTTNQERFYVNYTEYNRNNVYNSILYKTLLLIPKISKNLSFLDKVGRLLSDFPEVSNFSVTEEIFNKLQYDRKTERYKEALLISKMFLLNFRPDITGGMENVTAILFDMNKLWEEFIYRRLKKEELHFNLKVFAQRSKNFWLHGDTKRSKKIRPDIVIQYRETVIKNGIPATFDKTLIIDTKWKNLEDMNPGDNDLKQMFVYNLFWACDKSILLFPSTTTASTTGQYHSNNTPNEMGTFCGIETISILDEKGALDKYMGQMLMEKVLSKTISIL